MTGDGVATRVGLVPSFNVIWNPQAYPCSIIPHLMYCREDPHCLVPPDWFLAVSKMRYGVLLTMGMLMAKNR